MARLRIDRSTRNERIARKLMNMMPDDINCDVTYNRFRDCVTTYISIPEDDFRYLNALHHGDSDDTAELFCDMFLHHIIHYSRIFNKRGRRG